jgi:hypothetical protein
VEEPLLALEEPLPELGEPDEGEVELGEPEAAEEVGAALRVTPTAAHRAWAAASAFWRSLPVQELSMQLVVELMKAWLLQRHLSSVWLHPPVLAVAKQLTAQAKKLGVRRWCFDVMRACY